jgi:hypothetical protein
MKSIFLAASLFLSIPSAFSSEDCSVSTWGTTYGTLSLMAASLNRENIKWKMTNDRLGFLASQRIDMMIYETPENVREKLKDLKPLLPRALRDLKSTPCEDEKV